MIFVGFLSCPVISEVFEHCILDRYGDFLIAVIGLINLDSKSILVVQTNAIYVLRSVVDYYVSYGTTVNICALDLSKAFDRMNHHGLLGFSQINGQKYSC